MSVISVRRRAAAVAVALLGLLLAGCVDLGVESTFNEDGSVRHTVVGAIDRSALDQLSSLGGESGTITDQDSSKQLADERGLDYEPIDTADQVGGRFSKTFPDGGDIGATITELYNAAQSADSTPVPTGAFTGNFTRDGDEWTFELTIDSDAVMNTAGADTGDDTLDPGTLDQIFDFTYRATFPGTIDETNGTRLSDTEVQWDLPLTGSTVLTAKGTTGGGGGSSSWLIVVLVGGAIVVAGLVLGYLWMTRRRKTPVAAAPVGEALVVPPATEPVVPAESAPTGLESGTTPETQATVEIPPEPPVNGLDADDPEATTRIPRPPEEPQ